MIIGILTLLAVPTRWYVYHHGTHVQAKIHKLERRTSKKGGDYYVVGFDYQLNGRRYSEEFDSISADEGMRTKIGDTIDGHAASVFGHAEFLKSSLDINDDVLRLGLWSLGWNGLLSVFVYLLWIHPIRQRLLVRNGDTASGTITRRTETRGKGTTYTLWYSFRTRFGEDIETKANVSQVDYRDAFEGAAVTVIYDPGRPKRSVPYEYSDFLVFDSASIEWGSRFNGT
jgi:hypothetical protein